MLAAIVAGLLVLGLSVWFIGHSFSYNGVAAIGGALIIIAGSAVALTGLEVRTGSTRTFEYTQVNNTTVRDRAVVNYDYQTTTLATILNVGVAGSLGFGGLLMLLGAVLMSQTLSQEA